MTRTLDYRDSMLKAYPEVYSPAALEALESAVERRREADRDENELAIRIQALGADRSRLADELDGSLVKSRRLERANREIAERLDAAIGTIRSVLDGGESS